MPGGVSSTYPPGESTNAVPISSSYSFNTYFAGLTAGLRKHNKKALYFGTHTIEDCNSGNKDATE